MKGAAQPPRLLRALLPLAIGLGVVGFLLLRTVRENGGWGSVSGSVTLDGWPGALAALVGLVLLRDLGYVLRLRYLSNRTLTWRQAIETTVLWEFASAITPGIVGGGAVAIWGLHRQGLTAGRSTALVFSTAMLDELLYVAALPILLYTLGTAAAPADFDNLLGWGVFWLSWGLLLLLSVMIALGLFWAPKATRSTLLWVSRRRGLKRWSESIAGFAEDLEASSREMKGLPVRLWCAAMAATAASWAARFLSLVAVMTMVVAPFSALDPLTIVARQMIMWVYLLISPTPGSSGVAEWLLGAFFSPWFDLSPSPIAPTATVLIWRMATHFIYLLLGVLVIPGWMRRTRRRL